MKYIKPFLLSCLSALVISGCAVGPYEEREDPQVPQGPGLFSGKDGVFTFSNVFDDKKRLESKKKQAAQKGGRVVYYDYGDVDLPAIDEQSFEDFEQFKAWRRASESGSIDYQEYQDWRAYQQYRRFKAQQQESASEEKPK